jgi:hypothetical protein
MSPFSYCNKLARLHIKNINRPIVAPGDHSLIIEEAGANVTLVIWSCKDAY